MRMHYNRTEKPLSPILPCLQTCTMKTFFSLLTFALAATATEYYAQQEKPSPSVLTATRIFRTIVPESPFLVTATSTVVWTQSPTMKTSPTDI
ncbi:hypothetical protein Ac2012v2_002961 [Leucoagaricus gongylophorus]